MSNLTKGPKVLLLVVFLFITFGTVYVNVTPTYATSPSFQVDQVDHTINVHEGALVIINDTLKLSPKAGLNTVTLQEFLLGFPDHYGLSLDYCYAYDPANPNAQLIVEYEAGLSRQDFYGVKVVFPKPGLVINNGESRYLTVIFVFSNLISAETSNILKLDFPMYPSLTQNASVCNVTVVLPPRASISNSTFHENDLNFTVTPWGGTQVLRHEKRPCESFEFAPAWLRFNMSFIPFPIIELNEVKREIKLDKWGAIYVSNVLALSNRGYQIDHLKVSLPEGAFDLVVRDDFGSLESFSENETVTLFLRELLYTNDPLHLFLSYRLPWKKYVNQQNGVDYALNFTFFEKFDWTIRQLAFSVTLPEGAEFQSALPIEPHDVEEGVFKDTIRFTFFNATPLHELNFKITYRYLVFWASFHPTLWMGLLVVAISFVVYIRKAPIPTVRPSITIPSEDIRSFIDAYERKSTFLLDLESVEEQLTKRRISRRRYKIRKKTIEGRLSSLSRDLSNLREKIRSGGSKLADTIRQIEIAETQLDGVDVDIRRVETRYRSGEISKGAYTRLLKEYRERREQARMNIEGALLRLKEEIL